MSKLINLTGQKYGRLTVIKRSFPNSERRKARWLCKCECGKEKVVDGYHLREGHTKSCGCLGKENLRIRILPFGLASMRAAIHRYKRRAKMRGIEYKLTEEEFKEITQKDCYYCGAKPNNMTKDVKANGDYKYNGIDRVDNNKGYVNGNVVPCCWTCNAAKGTLTTQEFKSWVINIYYTLIDKGEIL